MPFGKHLDGRVFAALFLVVCAAGVAKADTVVLKNGRRIAAESALRENGKVICETPAGRLVLPESMVARIETDDQGAPLATRPDHSAASLQMDPPRIDFPGDASQIAHAVVHDNAIDRVVLERLNASASGGAADAMARAAAAESAASRFEFGRGDFAEALRHAERAAELMPGQADLLLNVAYLHLRRGDYVASLDFLERARRLAPDSPDVAKLTGWADYALNRLPQAVAEWKRAQHLVPAPEVAAALSKAELELQTESSFRENQSSHFDLRYSGSEAPDLARAVLESLEDDFTQISSAVNYSPVEPIAVLLYTNQAFADITRAPRWVGALNDGKIRIPVQGLVSVTPELAGVLKHELTHSFVNEKTHGRCPVWLQEGLAQWMEGKRAGKAAATLLALYDRHQDPSLTLMEGSWLNLSPDVASIAYAWSLAVVETLEVADPGNIDRLLDRIAIDPSPEEAVRNALHMSYDDLGSATAVYLRRSYLPLQR